MGDVLRARLLQSHFESAHHEAILSLLVAAAHVLEGLDQACAKHGLTRGQYNVLRILRGVFPEGYARCEIARRLVERAPDVTRLIDRLQREKLVERVSSSADRRLSVTRITRRGLQLIDRMRDDIAALHQEVGRRLTDEESLELARLTELLYAEADPERSDTMEKRSDTMEKRSDTMERRSDTMERRSDPVAAPREVVRARSDAAPERGDSEPGPDEP